MLKRQEEAEIRSDCFMYLILFLLENSDHIQQYQSCGSFDALMRVLF